MRLLKNLIVIEDATWFWFDIPTWIKRRTWMPLSLYRKIWRLVFFGIFVSRQVCWIRTPVVQLGIYKKSRIQGREGFFSGFMISSFEHKAYLGRWVEADGN